MHQRVVVSQPVGLHERDGVKSLALWESETDSMNRQGFEVWFCYWLSSNLPSQWSRKGAPATRGWLTRSSARTEGFQVVDSSGNQSTSSERWQKPLGGQMGCRSLLLCLAPVSLPSQESRRGAPATHDQFTRRSARTTACQVVSRSRMWDWWHESSRCQLSCHSLIFVTRFHQSFLVKEVEEVHQWFVVGQPVGLQERKGFKSLVL